MPVLISEENIMNILFETEAYSIENTDELRRPAKFCKIIYIIIFLAAVSIFGLAACKPATTDAPQVSNNNNNSNNNSNSNINSNYATYGVHNDPSISPCASSNCIYTRGSGEPADPVYPEYWVSNWNMYRIYNKYSEYPPPYDGVPPKELVEGTDYEKSTGTTYYDSTWTEVGGEGAMMEHYKDRCLPIFPISNKFTCSFISLGKTAFFVTYDQDRPEGMPPVCLFSSFNHPPRRDFIKHLPYSKGDSEQIGTGGQGYSFWISAGAGTPTQTGVKPVPDIKENIMFGYGFAPKDGKIMPQSFYFSGYPFAPANAPFVSQNYADFKVVQPNPAETWDQVNKLDPTSLPQCQLFDPPKDSKLLEGTTKQAPTWSDIGRWKKTDAK